jgi:hypothetical protein
MEKKYFSLETKDDNRFIKITRIIFGLVCVGIAIFWLIYRIMSGLSDSSQWITIGFLSLFGAFQVYAGFGYAERFIEFDHDKIRLKQNSVLPPIILTVSSMTKIDIYPFKVLFITKIGKPVLLRFGVSEPGKVESIKTELISFAERNSLTTEMKSE